MKIWGILLCSSAALAAGKHSTGAGSRHHETKGVVDEQQISELSGLTTLSKTALENRAEVLTLDYKYSTGIRLDKSFLQEPQGYGANRTCVVPETTMPLYFAKLGSHKGQAPVSGDYRYAQAFLRFEVKVPAVKWLDKADRIFPIFGQIEGKSIQVGAMKCKCEAYRTLVSGCKVSLCTDDYEQVCDVVTRKKDAADVSMEIRKAAVKAEAEDPAAGKLDRDGGPGK